MMVTTKRLVALAAVAVTALTATVAQAQGPGPGGPSQQQMQAQMKAAQEKLYKDLGITATQKSKLQAIEKKYMGQIQAKGVAMQKKYPNPKPEQRQQLQTEFIKQIQPLGVKMQSEMMAVLTPAQKTKLKKMQADQMKKMGNAKPN